MDGLGLVMSRLYLKFRLQKFRPPAQGYTVEGFKLGKLTPLDFHLYCCMVEQKCETTFQEELNNLFGVVCRMRF